MSHFTVLVIGDDPEGQLEPYDENTEVEEYDRECSCGERKAMMAAREKVDKEYKTIEDLRKEFAKKPIKERTEENWRKFIGKYERMEKKFIKEIGINPDPKCSSCKGTGIYKSTYNPKSKWDWYSEGGRYDGMFILKSTGKKANSGIMKDIDWKGMEKRNREEAGKHYDKIMAEVKAGKEPIDMLEFIYGIKTGQTRAEFTKDCVDQSTFAVVMDGEWYEKGKMGWWAIVTDEMDDKKWRTMWKKMVMGLPPDTLLTCYDCHI